jgi:hypothetical protein
MNGSPELEEVLGSMLEPPSAPFILSTMDAPSKKLPVYPAFHWVPPDLNEGSKFYNDHGRTLIYTSQSFPNPDALLRDGLKILRIHWGNYTKAHPLPRHLQLIWWEFSPTHWADLKDGSSPNF